jgi:hypothetical protein
MLMIAAVAALVAELGNSAALDVLLTSLIDVSAIFLKNYVDKMSKTAAMDDLR